MATSENTKYFTGLGRFHEASIFSFENRWNHHVEMDLESGMVVYQIDIIACIGLPVGT